MNMAMAILHNGSYKIIKSIPKVDFKQEVISKIVTDKTIGNLRFIDYRHEDSRYSVMISSLKGFGSEVKRAFRASGDSIHVQVLSLGNSFVVDINQPINFREIQEQLQCSINDAIHLTELMKYLYQT